MTGYGSYVADWKGGFAFQNCAVHQSEFGGPNAETARAVAAELLAWADAHDTVTLVVPKETAEWYASASSVPGDRSYPVKVAARKALGMES